MKHFILSFFILFNLLIIAQESSMLLGGKTIVLKRDTTIDFEGQSRFLLKNNSDVKKISFLDVPTNVYQQISNIDTVQVIDNQVEFYCACVDSVKKRIKKFEFVEKNKRLRNVSFKYQVLGKDLRISERYTPKTLKGRKGKKMLKKLFKLVPYNGGIILYSIAFYDKNNNRYLVNIGASCILKRHIPSTLQ